jgi:hypothetical protein
MAQRPPPGLTLKGPGVSRALHPLKQTGNNEMTLRKIASVMVAFGLVLGLFGAGISAQFTDSATAGMNINVGTFNVDISSPQGTVSGSTVTFTAPTIQSSAPGSAPFAFTVTSTGSIPAVVSVSATSVAAPFSDILGPVATFTLSQGESHVFNAGLQWAELFNADLGASRSITYTVSAAG